MAPASRELLVGKVARCAGDTVLRQRPRRSREPADGPGHAQGKASTLVALIENEKKASTLPSASGRIVSDSAKVEVAPTTKVPETETVRRATRPRGSMPDGAETRPSTSAEVRVVLATEVELQRDAWCVEMLSSYRASLSSLLWLSFVCAPLPSEPHPHSCRSTPFSLDRTNLSRSLVSKDARFLPPSGLPAAEPLPGDLERDQLCRREPVVNRAVGGGLLLRTLVFDTALAEASQAIKRPSN